MSTPKYGRQFVPEMYFTGNDLLIAQSIYEGDTVLVSQIPDSEVNRINETGICFLIYSIYAHNERAMEILLGKGADPNIYCEVKPKPEEFQEEMTPLYCIARRSNSLSFVKTLLRYGANPNDNRSRPALIAAIMRNDRQMVDFLLDHGADINIQTKLTKATVVVTAAHIHDFDMVNHLLDKGANPMLRDVDGGCLAYTVQHQINRGRGSDKYKKDLQDLKKRLESMGVVFPVEKIPPTKEETYEYKPPTPMSGSTPSSAPQAQNPQKKKWSILFDDDDNVI